MSVIESALASAYAEEGMLAQVFLDDDHHGLTRREYNRAVAAACRAQGPDVVKAMYADWAYVADAFKRGVPVDSAVACFEADASQARAHQDY